MNILIRTALFFFLLFPAAAFSAQPATGCHCFRDRTFNPADTFASDGYLLTTVFNSLTASYFSIPKRQIVMLKMKGGVHNEDLLIALYAGSRMGLEATDLLAEKKDGSWQQVLAEKQVPQSLRHDELYNRIREGLPVEDAAGDIIREILNDRFGIMPESFAALVRQGASLREIALIFTLAEHVRTTPETIFSQYHDWGFSWSQIAHNFGLQPADVGKLADSRQAETR
ncbi:MAG: hypothetical protein SCH71_06620 [Desulfobulbaceae bacterium]|nr:hypothetical protein [Desulfobulbaceae bacterium]